MSTEADRHPPRARGIRRGRAARSRSRTAEAASALTEAAPASEHASIEQAWPAPLIPALTEAQPTCPRVPRPLSSRPSSVEPIFGPSLIESPLLIIGRPLPTETAHYPIVANSQVGFFLDRFTRERREVISTWLGRSGRFMSMIRETLKRHGLPEDLAFTAMIESGFNPVATSRAGARGLWQFMAATAKRYGLRVDQWVDERLDPEKSTVAAAAYLRDLYNLFGSWFLAQAAYNAGEATIARAIRATGSSDFWTLARTSFLQRETKEFVPQIVAATQIGREPHRFGFEPVQPSSSAVDRVAVPPETDLRWLSASTGISVESLQSLNPALVKGVTPPGGNFELNVPEGASSQVLAAVQRPRRVVVTFPRFRASARVGRWSGRPRRPAARHRAVDRQAVWRLRGGRAALERPGPQGSHQAGRPPPRHHDPRGSVRVEVRAFATLRTFLPLGSRSAAVVDVPEGSAIRDVAHALGIADETASARPPERPGGRADSP